ncbi:MAG TPA: YbaB/EbfC family nucleoid-associated protein [Streptosporangiaceae bacterium]|nr:YbaB/EbfC family nucleoid-associated protein [Streptosporangiaceae bacterium]
MNGFGDFANIDVDKLLREAQGQQARMQEMRERLAELVGHASDESGLVTATYTTAGGLTDLELKPRALAQGSQDLAATIRQVVQDASNDLQEQIRATMADVFPDHKSPLDPEAAMEKAKEAQAGFDRMMTDAMGELDKIRKRLGL